MRPVSSVPTNPESKTSTKNKYKSPKAKELAKTVSDAISDTMPDLGADTTLTVEQALDLSVPQFDDGIEAASKYITAVHAVLKRGDERLATLAACIGTWVICSTPPASNSSALPLAIVEAAKLNACKLEAQRRLIVTPGIDAGRPASNEESRAIFFPCSRC